MKKVLLLITMFFITITLSGCLIKDNMENITIYTSVYPIEYVTNILYGDHAEIVSIYPDGININQYKLTKKQIKDYSKGDLFIYNGVSNEIDYAVNMLNQNKKLKIIDASMALEYENSIEEIWMNPSNLLMLARNVKEGFHEYISSTFLKREIDNKYEELQIILSELDAETQLLVQNAPYNKILVGNNLFKYLEKYDLEVISLAGDSITEKKLLDVKDLIEKEEIKYIYLLEDEKPNTIIKDLIDSTEIEILYFNPLNNLTEEQRNNNDDYLSLTKKNIEELKKELYK